jgi:hypothetical protein
MPAVTQARQRTGAAPRAWLFRESASNWVPQDEALSVLLYHGLRREELCLLKIRDMHARRGVPHLRIHGKDNKLRYLPLHLGSAERIHIYLEAAGHGETPGAPLFQPVRRNTGARLPPMASTRSCSVMQKRLRSGCRGLGFTACAQRRRPTHPNTRRISPRSRSGWVMQISPPRGSMIGAKVAPKTPPTFRVTY